MYGCRYCEMDGNYNEVCKLTGELTKGSVTCDSDYENCPEYKKALEPIRPKSKTKPKLMQTSIFGAAGEKVFNG